MTVAATVENPVENPVEKYLRMANMKFYCDPLRILRLISVLPSKAFVPKLALRFIKRTFFS